MSDNRSRTRPVRGHVVLTAKLANGELVQWSGPRVPRHWKSAIMHLAPYGTDFTGAVFTKRTPVTQAR